MLNQAYNRTPKRRRVSEEVVNGSMADTRNAGTGKNKLCGNAVYTYFRVLLLSKPGPWFKNRTRTKPNKKIKNLP